MTLEQLRIFAAVADALHFTRAAETLRLSQPAVSAAVAALEAEHGLRLFDRIGRRVELTAAGALLRDEARSILRKVEETGAMLAELSGLTRGTLRLVASQTVGNHWLPPRLARFAAAFPGIRIDLSIGNSEDVAEAVRDGRAELGIAEGAVSDPSLMSDVIPGDRLVLAVGRGHPWAGRGAVAPADLAAARWILREPGSGTRALFEAAIRDVGLDPAALTVAMTLPGGSVIRHALLAGLGASVLSDLVVSDELRDGRLVAVGGLALPERGFHLVRHRDRHRSAAEREFVRLAVIGS
ncbi:LysR substrate-binding domain-containing protein [Azospirillum doebereinerae]|uniref:LysR family transcriptional regulator n=1 Tax=Azospirillum doebereinerae TaxID=92933 RepID=A0A433J8D9_9PROT|nr:LysR substrate-binding domain-containing protein [Azospirillum doebereinerae]MCG5240397.1 LysR substrate-binding domain-containing protein [Azospirillum doebereinerae]RUQ70262.1 LysR family transcriptional regulator [Azospirillum doebereinerae]